MAVLISSVEAGSYAEKAKIEAGDELLTINGNEIVDVLDYRFYESERKLVLVIKKQNGKGIKTWRLSTGKNCLENSTAILAR